MFFDVSLVLLLLLLEFLMFSALFCRLIFRFFFGDSFCYVVLFFSVFNFIFVIFIFLFLFGEIGFIILLRIGLFSGWKFKFDIVLGDDWLFFVVVDVFFDWMILWLIIVFILFILEYDWFLFRFCKEKV